MVNSDGSRQPEGTVSHSILDVVEQGRIAHREGLRAQKLSDQALVDRGGSWRSIRTKRMLATVLWEWGLATKTSFVSENHDTVTRHPFTTSLLTGAFRIPIIEDQYLSFVLSGGTTGLTNSIVVSTAIGTAFFALGLQDVLEGWTFLAGFILIIAGLCVLLLTFAAFCLRWYFERTRQKVLADCEDSIKTLIEPFLSNTYLSPRIESKSTIIDKRKGRSRFLNMHMNDERDKEGQRDTKDDKTLALLRLQALEARAVEVLVAFLICFINLSVLAYYHSERDCTRNHPSLSDKSCIQVYRLEQVSPSLVLFPFLPVRGYVYRFLELVSIGAQLLSYHTDVFLGFSVSQHVSGSQLFATRLLMLTLTFFLSCFLIIRYETQSKRQQFQLWVEMKIKERDQESKVLKTNDLVQVFIPAARIEQLVTNQPVHHGGPDVVVGYCVISRFSVWTSQFSLSAVPEIIDALYSAFDSHRKKFGLQLVANHGDLYCVSTLADDLSKDSTNMSERVAKAVAAALTEEEHDESRSSQRSENPFRASSGAQSLGGFDSLETPRKREPVGEDTSVEVEEAGDRAKRCIAFCTKQILSVKKLRSGLHALVGTQAANMKVTGGMECAARVGVAMGSGFGGLFGNKYRLYWNCTGPAFSEAKSLALNSEESTIAVGSRAVSSTVSVLAYKGPSSAEIQAWRDTRNLFPKATDLAFTLKSMKPPSTPEVAKIKQVLCALDSSSADHLVELQQEEESSTHLLEMGSTTTAGQIMAVDSKDQRSPFLRSKLTNHQARLLFLHKIRNETQNERKRDEAPLPLNKGYTPSSQSGSTVHSSVEGFEERSQSSAAVDQSPSVSAIGFETLSSHKENLDGSGGPGGLGDDLIEGDVLEMSLVEAEQWGASKCWRAFSDQGIEDLFWKQIEIEVAESARFPVLAFQVVLAAIVGLGSSGRSVAPIAGFILVTCTGFLGALWSPHSWTSPLVFTCVLIQSLINGCVLLLDDENIVGTALGALLLLTGHSIIEGSICVTYRTAFGSICLIAVIYTIINIFTELGQVGNVGILGLLYPPTLLMVSKLREKAKRMSFLHVALTQQRRKEAEVERYVHEAMLERMIPRYIVPMVSRKLLDLSEKERENDVAVIDTLGDVALATFRLNLRQRFPGQLEDSEYLSALVASELKHRRNRIIGSPISRYGCGDSSMGGFSTSAISFLPASTSTVFPASDTSIANRSEDSLTTGPFALLSAIDNLLQGALQFVEASKRAPAQSRPKVSSKLSISIIQITGDDVSVGGPLRKRKSKSSKLPLDESNLDANNLMNESSCDLAAKELLLLLSYLKSRIDGGLTAIIGRGDTSTVVLGRNQPRFDLAGFLPRTNAALLNATVDGQVFATPEFTRLLLSGTSKDATNGETLLQRYGKWKNGGEEMWRVQGCGKLVMTRLLSIEAAQ